MQLLSSLSGKAFAEAYGMKVVVEGLDCHALLHNILLDVSSVVCRSCLQHLLVPLVKQTPGKVV